MCVGGGEGSLSTFSINQYLGTIYSFADPINETKIPLNEVVMDDHLEKMPNVKAFSVFISF